MTEEPPRPWKQTPWQVHGGAATYIYSKTAVAIQDFDAVLAATTQLIALAPEMAEAILYITAAETGEDLGYRAEMLDGLRDKLKEIIDNG